MDNNHIAHELLAEARQAAASGDNLYRVRALRRAAMVIQALDRPVTALVASDGGRELRSLPGVGASLARTIAQLALKPVRDCA